MAGHLFERATSCVVVAAHPDDETLSAGGLIGRLPLVSVVHVTDGAPRDRRFFPAGLRLSREGYAALRREEAAAALSLAGVPGERIRCLGAVAQEAMEELSRLASDLCRYLVDAAPEIVIAHPYEGGHPDHDAAAFTVHAAVALLRRAGRRTPRVIEAASYHGARGRFTPGELLPAPGCPEVCVELSADDRARKQAMLACFASQREAIARFPIAVERFRPAPAYDFTRPPHEGLLYYERLGWPTSGADLCEKARASLRELEIEG